MSMCKAKANYAAGVPAVSISYKEVLRSTTDDLSHEVHRGTKWRVHGLQDTAPRCFCYAQVADF